MRLRIVPLIIKDSTHDERNLDDLMRALYSRFADKRGFTTTGVQNAANDVCGCTLNHEVYVDICDNAAYWQLRYFWYGNSKCR